MCRVDLGQAVRKLSRYLLVLAAINLATTSRAEAAEDALVKVQAAWTKATPPGAKVGSGYLVLQNTGERDDRLLRIEALFAERIEIHSISVDNGLMQMRPLDAPLVIPNREEIRLEPGGLHLMMIGLKEPLREGTKVQVTFHFERSGALVVDLPVAKSGATRFPQ